ncbi:hypothetical protein U1Q18_009535 [Sarracenia purpurea var. burkii]
MAIAVVVMTMITTPVMIATQGEKQFVMYKRRTVQKSKANEDIRLLVCIHGIRSVPTIFNLLEASNATRESHIYVFALQLVELIGRATTVRVVHQPGQRPSQNIGYLETDQIVATFENFGRRRDFVSVQQLLVRSAYSTMDEEICSVAEEKRAAFIILPFHSQQNILGEMEVINPAIREVNQNVLENAPCSVGILIDRGLSHGSGIARRIAVLYFGGPDDREALAYALRISKHPDVSLRVVRFLQTSGNTIMMEPTGFMTKSQEIVAVNVDRAKEEQIDDAFLDRFQSLTESDPSIHYSELFLQNEEETVKAIMTMDQSSDLYIVGRGRGVTSPLTEGIADWCDSPELGAIGDVLVSSRLSHPFAVLVVQQYTRTGPRRSTDESATTGSDIDGTEWRSAPSEGGGYGSFVSRRSDATHGYD